MIEREFTIVNRLGLHARAASKLVHLAGGFSCSVTMGTEDETVDAKSILGILLLAAGQGKRVVVACDGDDEEDAMLAIAELLEAGFDEGAAS